MIHNLRVRFERLLARYLQRRGWVVFWLDHEVRRCRVYTGTSLPPICPDGNSGCWLALYNRTWQPNAVPEFTAKDRFEQSI